MNKAEIIEKLSNNCEITKTEAERIYDEIFRIYGEALAKDDAIMIQGFGNFKVVEKKGKLGRNPKTGEEVKIPTIKTVKFKPGLVLKEKVNK